MARFVFIVQGTGRGHLSQAVALQEILDAAGHQIVAVYTGGRPGLDLPAYYQEAFKKRHETFPSPWFLSLPNRKGIYIGRTMIWNLMKAPVYLKAVGRLRREITGHRPDVVVNFYELIGALAMRGLPRGIGRVALGHHFLLHLEDYPCGSRNRVQEVLLRIHTRTILRSCEKALALSFRSREGKDKIAVVPPLVRKSFREGTWKPGGSYLVYLLQEGFIADLIRLARTDPDLSCDVFSTLPPDSIVPPGIRLHEFGEASFREKMLSCKALLSTAGFDALAEAACLGVPLGVVPSEYHFEQQCNARDLEASGLGFRLEGFGVRELERITHFPTKDFREWVDSAGDLILKELSVY